MPLVSVIIPAYNCADYIGETIGSILGQKDVHDIEIIVVNDGSVDATGDVARSYGGCVRVIDQSNSGVSVARNRGIKEARGEFLALVDHDDYWLSNKLANQLQAFQDRPEVGAVFTDFVWWYPNEDDGRFEKPDESDGSAGAPAIDEDYSGWIYHQMLLDSWVLTSTALVRSSVVRSIGGFDETLPLSEDWDFWLRVSLDFQFLKLKEATTLYRQHPTQGSRVIREIDYRTRLLESAHKRWGLCSKDGRCLSASEFDRQLAKYSTGFGLIHLKGGKGASKLVAMKSFLKALSIDITYWRSGAYLLLALFGWKPKW